MDKLWDSHTIEHYSVIKINDLSSYARSWTNLKCLLLSDKSQSEKSTHGIIPSIHHYRKGKTTEKK